jgi:flagellar assembly factor FliW
MPLLAPAKPAQYPTTAATLLADLPSGGSAIRELASLAFPRGLPGFVEQHAFALRCLERNDRQAWYLVGSGAPPPILRVIPLARPLEIYRASDLAAGCEVAGIAMEKCLVLLVARSVAGDQESLMANLRAPILVDIGSRLGAQVIMSADRYAMRAPLTAGSAIERAIGP